MSISTYEQIDDFSEFAKRRLREGVDTSIDDLYGEWRFRTFSEIDELAVKASLRDLANGINGRPTSEFLDEFDATVRRDNNPT